MSAARMAASRRFIEESSSITRSPTRSFGRCGPALWHITPGTATVYWPFECQGQCAGEDESARQRRLALTVDRRAERGDDERHHAGEAGEDRPRCAVRVECLEHQAEGR